MTSSITARPLAADVIKAMAYRSPSAPLSKTSRPPLTTHGKKGSIELSDLSNATTEELSVRAYFLCMAVCNSHKLKLGDLAESRGLDMSDQSMRSNLMHAIKLLTCASLFLIGIESGGMSNTKRTMELLILAFRFSDKISNRSPAKQLIALFGDCTPGDLNRTVSRLVVQAFNHCAIDQDFVDRYINEEIAYRKDVSEFACSQKTCVLKDHIPLFS
jgi:hypothetical protein